MQGIVIFIARYGLSGFVQYIYEHMEHMNYSSKSASARSLAFNIKVSRMLNEENISLNDLCLENFCGNLNLDLERLKF